MLHLTQATTLVLVYHHQVIKDRCYLSLQRRDSFQICVFENLSDIYIYSGKDNIIHQIFYAIKLVI